MASLYIPKGTKVLSEKSNLITLVGDAVVDNARRQKDGGYVYEVGGVRYFASAGTVILHS
jgi:hypothetical protein